LEARIMGFALPLSGSAAHEAMGDVSHVVEILSPANAHRLPTTIEALGAARRLLAAAPSASRVNAIVLRGDDERWLISIGRRGGWRKLWNFGSGA
jgi:hypothetical protein